MNRKHFLRTFEAASILLFFLQGLRVILSVMFGIIYDQVFLGPVDVWLVISNLLIFAVLLAPALAPHRRTGRWLAVFAVLAALARVALTVNDANVRYWGGLATLGFSGLYMAVLLKMDRPRFISGLVSALALDQLLRVMGHTYDLSLRPGWLPVQVIWAALVSIFAIWLSRGSQTEEERAGGIGWLGGLALGGFLFLETSLLNLPNGLARWSNMHYPAVAPLLLALTLLPLIPETHSWLLRMGRIVKMRVGLVVILLLGLLIGYFTAGVVAGVMLLAAQAAALALVVSMLGSSKTKSRVAGGRLALGLFLFLILNFLNAFAFTYPYVLPAMRGLGWIVYLAAGLAMGLGAIACDVMGQDKSLPVEDTTLITVAALAAIALSILAVWPQSTAPLAERGKLRAATYNIHYGYDDNWNFMLGEMAQAIEAADVDVIALQEVDAGRMTSFCVDDALYLAQRLRMNVVYMPAVEHLTGIALLYRGPLVPTDWQLLTSLQEQTGIVHARLEFRGQAIDAYGIWMGLSDEDTYRQIEEALAYIADSSPATFGGDFNAELGSPVVRAIETAGFRDAFVELGIEPAPFTSPAVDPDSRIDFVWFKGLKPNRAWVSDALASDHRMVVVEVVLP